MVLYEAWAADGVCAPFRGSWGQVLLLGGGGNKRCVLRIADCLDLDLCRDPSVQVLKKFCAESESKRSRATS